MLGRQWRSGSLKVLPLSGRTVLIVEDAYLIALEAQEMVVEAGAKEVMLASTLEDARRLLAHASAIDVCVVDLRLGEEDASPLIEEAAARGIAVVVATGFDSVIPNVDAPLLKKPYQETEFVEAIRAALRCED